MAATPTKLNRGFADLSDARGLYVPIVFVLEYSCTRVFVELIRSSTRVVVPEGLHSSRECESGQWTMKHRVLCFNVMSDFASEFRLIFDVGNKDR